LLNKKPPNAKRSHERPLFLDIITQCQCERKQTEGTDFLVNKDLFFVCHKAYLHITTDPSEKTTTMVKLFRKVFKDRNLTPWEKEVQKAKDATFRERNGSLTPSFNPRNGVYEYSRNFDYKGKNRKGSSYHAVLRLSFSPAPDYGWMITGIGTERMCVRGVEGGKQRKITIDDGRITRNGKFYWKEIREKDIEVLVTGE
jgi:hypothetical protein